MGLKSLFVPFEHFFNCHWLWEKISYLLKQWFKKFL